MDDLISRKAALYLAEGGCSPANVAEELRKLPAVQRWIPFRTRPLTAEEKEDDPDCDSILDCKLPDNGQRILVNIKCNGHEAVQMDEYYDDEECYLESGYDIGTEANAWMPLPEPWEGENDV